MNGKHSSRLAPMPLNRSSGSPPRPRWVATRRLTPSTSTNSTWGLLIAGERTAPAPDLPRDASRFRVIFGAGTSPPPCWEYHLLQWSHQLPGMFAWRADSQVSASSGNDALRKYFALGLVGGFTMLWMWPLEESTKSILPRRMFSRLVTRLPRRDVIRDAGDDVGRHVRPSTCRWGCRAPRSCPADLSGLSMNMRSRSAWNSAGSRVVSEFQ